MKSTITIQFESTQEMNEFLRNLNPEISIQVVPEGKPILIADQSVEITKTEAPTEQQHTEVIQETVTQASVNETEHITGKFHRNCRYCEKPFVATHNRTVTCDACRSKKATKPQKAAD